MPLRISHFNLSFSQKGRLNVCLYCLSSKCLTLLVLLYISGTVECVLMFYLWIMSRQRYQQNIKNELYKPYCLLRWDVRVGIEYFCLFDIMCDISSFTTLLMLHSQVNVCERSWVKINELFFQLWLWTNESAHCLADVTYNVRKSHTKENRFSW